MARTRRRNYCTGRKNLRDGQGHYLNWSTPSWWNNEVHTKRRRVELRRVTVRFMRNPSAADGLIRCAANLALQARKDRADDVAALVFDVVNKRR